MWGYLILVVVWLFNWFSHRVMAPGGNLGGDEPNYPQYVPPNTVGPVIIRTLSGAPSSIILRRSDLGTAFDVLLSNIGGALSVNTPGSTPAILIPTFSSIDVSSGSGTLLVGGANTVRVAILRGQGVPPVLSRQLTTLAAGAQTLSAAMLIQGLVEHPITGATTDTIDTGTNIDGQDFGVVNNDSFDTYIANTSAGANVLTIAAGVGITLKGTAFTVNQNQVAHLLFRRTGPGLWTVYMNVS